MRKLKIAFVSSGANQFIRPYLNFFQQKGPQIYLISYDSFEADRQSDYPIFDISFGASARKQGTKWRYLLAALKDRSVLKEINSDILTASDIFCYTSNWEGFPNALLEAMTSRLAVIATDFDDVRELITGNEMGIVVPRNDADAAVDAIQKYIDDPALAERLSNNAKKFTQSNFAMPVMVGNTIKLYQKLLDQK